MTYVWWSLFYSLAIPIGYFLFCYWPAYNACKRESSFLFFFYLIFTAVYLVITALCIASVSNGVAYPGSSTNLWQLVEFARASKVVAAITCAVMVGIWLVQLVFFTALTRRLYLQLGPRATPTGNKLAVVAVDPVPVITRTPGFNPYSVQWSPFHPDRIAIASAANFGIVGNGRLFVLQPGVPEKTFDTQDGIFDLAWSEIHEAQLATGGGDGSVKIFDITLPDFPLRSFHEHSKEVYSVDWNLVEKSLFLSSSWDLTCKLWNPEANKSLGTWGGEHSNCIYQAAWNPRSAFVFATASGDSTCKIWDTRQPRSTTTLKAHSNEVLSLDWNKYHPDQLVTGSVDTSIKSWDLRNIHLPLVELRGHGYAVRRVKASPHDGNLVGSASYDMTVRIWNLALGQQVFVYDGHSEFCLGLDFNLFKRGQLATCAWDESMRILSLGL
ncbi:peroxisomal targeting signal 2 receptor [Kappamyces sp. JEL0680]|nr:peroxisomal targeting signal 2 receptor [Kappamyces sp. JEL0680]